MSVITNSFAAKTLQVSKNPVQILKIEGRAADAAAATSLWLQVWDTTNASTDTATGVVLKKSFPIYGGGGTGQGAEFFKSFYPGDDELEMKLGLYLATSTTEATFTAPAAGDNWGALSIETRIPEQPASVSTAGDLTSAVAGLQVWTEAAGASAAKRLLSLEIDPTNLTGTTQWLMLFAKDTVNTGDAPAQEDIFPITCGASGIKTGTNAFRFGTYGREMLVNDGGTYRYGCTVKISSTAATFTAAAGTATIRARYLTSP